uniref:Putative peritrophin-like protein n=1 Tax=Nyssomyia neivai TaxID=330878 RepID=A0A1L8E425_9DIPT
MFLIVAKFLSFLLLFVAVKAENEVPDVKHQRTFLPRIQPQVAERAQVPISPALVTTPQNCSGRYDAYCYDCRTLIVCAGDEQPIAQTTCPFTEPYCDYSSHCGYPRCMVNMQYKEMEDSCNNVQTTVQQQCTSGGYYPDVNDARKYYFCHGSGDTNADVYTCPTDYIFDTIKYNCKRVIPYDCTGKVNEFIHHATNPAYYAYCRVNGGYKEVIPYKCRDEQNFAYNIKTSTCEYKCKGEGHFVDRESCQHYYECYRTGNALSYRRLRCSNYGSYYFSKEEGKCLPDNRGCMPEIGWM